MTHFLKNGNTFKIVDHDSIDIRKKLPVGTYVVKEDQYENLFLEGIDDFELSGKHYGDNDELAHKILNTFNDRKSSTGVMLSGEKGSGKTLLAKTISNFAIKQDIPTIVINSAWHGDKFNKMIQCIDHPCVVLFDEFEKVYNKDTQEHILTLLDGVFPSKKLFVFTCNDKWSIDKHMQNRPGRIYYFLDFVGLDEEFIKEYCFDNLHDKENIDRICNITNMFQQFNFDMLKALVEEINRYGENPQQALKMLNINPESDISGKYSLELYVDDKHVEITEDNWTGNPLNVKYKVWVYTKKEYDEDESYSFSGEDLVLVEPKNNRYIFENGSAKLIMTERQIKKFDYTKLF